MLHELIRKLGEPVVLLGMFGQFVFMMRFVVQWYASETQGRSVIPISFWYISIAGGLIVLVYGFLDIDPVIILGQSLGLLIYLRNLMLIYRETSRARAAAAPAGGDGP